MPPMTPSRVTGGLTQSSSSHSGVFFQRDGLSQSVVNSHLSSSFVNSSSTVSGAGHSNLGLVSGDMNNAVLNSVANSAPSVGASSLVTDANSALSGGPHLQRSASVNTDSYLRLPASPMSFTSNNISISGSSVIDGSSVVQQSSHQDQNVQQLQQNQQQQLQGASSATSLPASQTGPSTLHMGAHVPGSFIHDPNNVSQLSKKPRLDIKQEDIMQQQQVIQQILQRQDSMQLQGRNPQLQALLQQQQRLRQQQLFQSMPQLQRVQLQQQQQQQQQQMQLRQQLQQQVMQPSSAVKRPYDNSVSGVCARRLMQYLYHQRQRPNDNSIAYWRKFVAEYYSHRAKKRWCLSLYNNVGHHALGVFPPAAMDAWQCDICGSKSGRGFEATYEVLPRLNEIKFGSGVIDELLFLDLPREIRFPSGAMMLEYAKAVQESVYEQLRVVREGQLRIIFTQDLKILSWEFCARRHEELIPRRLVAPQVNQLVQVAQKCQSTIAESGADGVSQQDLQTNSNMVLTAGRQLAKILELQSLNDLGFSKRYVRCLQISEVVNSMKDLIDICEEHKIGAIESLKNYPRLATASKLQMQKMQEMEQMASVHGLPTDRNTLNKLMAMNPGLNNHINSTHNMVNRGALSGSAHLVLTNYQNLLMRQNSMNSSPGSNPGSSFNNSNPSPSSALQGAGPSLITGSMQNSVGGFPGPHLPPQQQQQQQLLQQRTLSGNGLLQQSHSQGSQGNQALQQQQMIQQLVQEMSNNNGGMQSQSLGGPNANGNLAKNALGFGGHAPSLSGGSVNVPGNNGPISRNNSFKTASNSDSSAAGGNNGFNPRTSDMPQSLHLQGMVQDIGHEFADSSFFNSDLDDNMGFGWKA
ncbi:probable transcriptional regulator SLK2 [Vigna radiata var. radiata]|uniref:Probable transcriptional regulator SLK2 n=1 Tax=Vigna radiata var. radiata TaxID=3916 RepID=A0A1S3V2C0_VIGRR|nr:probable transcriptional regulator SLK2 [Vigna radiata var. radiata]XP_014512453.1 probable transcriptional regulator SLK2 [Vigna radiata var. radiata]